MSFARLPSLRPRKHDSLQFAYSMAHVGSFCSSVCTSSSGLPDGSTRRRIVKDADPHLHKPFTWMLPFSPTMSTVKLLRHDSRVPCNSNIGCEPGNPTMK